MKQIPSLQANGRSASQSILKLLQNPKIHYRVRNYMPIVPILNQKNPVRTLTHYHFEVNFNIIFHLGVDSKWFLHKTPLELTQFL